MDKMIKVKPPLGLDKKPKMVPRRPRLVIRRRKGEDWPRECISPNGEDLVLTPYLRDAIRSGDLLEVGEPKVSTPATKAKAQKSKGPTQKANVPKGVKD